MSNETQYTFRTKTGTCTITPEQIILMREGARGTAAERIVGDSIGRALLIYGLLGGGALIIGLWYLLGGDTGAGVVFGVIGALFLWNVVKSRNNSAAPIIDRSAIRAVEAHPPRPPATRGYFTVFFEEHGKVRKRLIMLPGVMENGGGEYERAVEAMRTCSLLTAM
jgi:hypothetical protein